MTIATLLEDFASTSDDIPNEPQKPEDLIGYSMGYDAGVADAASQNAQAIRELTGVLEELGFGYQEALQELKKSLQPLFHTLVEKIVPDCLDASVQAMAIEAIESAATHDIENPITLIANPAHIESLKNAAESITSIPLSLKADSLMSISELRFQTATQETSIDADLLKSRITEALSAFLDVIDEKVVKNG